MTEGVHPPPHLNPNSRHGGGNQANHIRICATIMRTRTAILHNGSCGGTVALGESLLRPNSSRNLIRQKG